MNTVVMPDIDLKSKPFDKISYRMDIHDPHTSMFHMHDGLEIGHIIRGSGEFIVENKIYGFERGSITLINGRLSHCARPASHDEYVRNKIHFSSQYMQSVLRSMGKADLLDPFFQSEGMHAVMQLSEQSSEKIDQLFREMHEETCAQEYGYVQSITAKLVSLLILVNRNSKRKEDLFPPNALYQHAFKVIDSVSAHLESFSLDELASELFLSKYYLCHSFKKATGSTIWRYVLAKKIDRAKEMLRSTDIPVSQLAMDLGFSSFSLFSRSFKRLTGQSPSEYRRAKE